MYTVYYMTECIELPTVMYPRDRRGRDRMVVGFITIYANSAYYH